MSIDCHVHLFIKDQAAVAQPRHRPKYDATFDQLRALAEPHGIAQFVLVQTSFMGTDNKYLLSHLESEPERFKGVFILDPNTTASELRELKSRGVAGIRLNLFGTNLNETLNDAQLAFIARCAAEKLSVGIHDDAARLIGILDRINTRADQLVIDHFGRPESLTHAECDPLYTALLSRMSRLNCHVKISAPYRAPNMDPVRAFKLLSEALGPDKLLWASDWPWTQNEDFLTYATWVRPFEEAAAQPSLAESLSNNARQFYGFTASSLLTKR